MIDAKGKYKRHKLGAGRNASPQAVIPAGTWFAAELAGAGRYALVSCAGAPGFEFADFELAGRAALCRRYPAHRRQIRRLTSPR